ncbi:MAG: peptidase S8 [Vulcanimicrobiaceae bacterium]
MRYLYNLPERGYGAGQTVAVVVAYDNPNAEADLAVYRSTFGLTPCTTINGCFRKIAGNGSALPQIDAGWSVESSLDLDAVSAVCQDCKLLLVEAASNQIPDLAAAVDAAVTAGATVVNNSYGVDEAADNVQYASHYVHPGVAITAAAGDIGPGVQFPASVPTVTAVGGTSIQQIGGGGIQELVWARTGGGCSAFFPKPVWQLDTGCTGRTVNDVSMVADPADGLAVYDSTFPGTTHGGWAVIGGTSLSAPLVASVFALGAAANGVGTNEAIYHAVRHHASTTTPSRNPWMLTVTGGSNGTCAVAYLCGGVVGYSAPAGNGVAWGVNAFALR